MKCNSNEDLKAYILKNFEYKDGVITRNDRKNSNGSIDKYGYLIIKVKGRQIKAHRIAWLLCNGDFPDTELDHINRNKLDNRIENLRESNRYEQNRNKPKKINKDTGVVGIHYDTTKGLRNNYAFSFNKKTYRFRNLEDAVREKERLHNECK